MMKFNANYSLGNSDKWRIGTRKPLSQKAARKTNEMSKKGRESAVIRAAPTNIVLRFSHIN